MRAQESSSNIRNRLAVALAAAVASAAAAPTFAADVYYQPQASLTVEGDTNLDMDPGSRSRTEGNVVSLATVIGIATPTSDSTIRPRVEYRDYPEDSGDNRFEGYLDFNTTQRWQRSTASVFGSLEHRDEVNAEFNSALYDPINPVSPTSPQTGRAEVGATRDSGLLVPSYTYKFTPVIGAGVSGIYQHVNYSPNDDIDHVNFNYYLGKAELTWSVTQRSELSFGGFDSKYQATRADIHATGSGGTVDLDTSWTPLWSTTLSAVYEHANVTETQPEVLNSTANAWGATVSVTYKSQVGQLRLNAGRLITPSSGAGALYVNDQIKTQYDRELSERFSFTAALIGLRNRGITGNVAGDDRKYLQSVIEAKWMLTRTWFVQGGYQYSWQKYEVDPDGAANNRVYVRIAYQGLGPQR
jgi:hypothetical protein